MFFNSLTKNCPFKTLCWYYYFGHTTTKAVSFFSLCWLLCFSVCLATSVEYCKIEKRRRLTTSLDLFCWIAHADWAKTRVHSPAAAFHASFRSNIKVGLQMIPWTLEKARQEACQYGVLHFFFFLSIVFQVAVAADLLPLIV